MNRALLPLLLAVLSTQAVPRYVDISNPNPTPPFTSWSTAATNIQHAVDASQSGDTVWVASGIYAKGVIPSYTWTSNRLVVNKPIAVRSVSGPAHTLIVGSPDPSGGHGDGAVRCVYLSNGALLDGFTLTNGFTRRVQFSQPDLSIRGGGACCEGSAVMTNCVIIGNRSAGDGGGVHGGFLDHCLIARNSTLDYQASNGDGGGADHSTLFHCIVRENHGRKGGGADNCTLVGCALIGNRARVWGGGAARSTLLHCTVVDNSSRYSGGVSRSQIRNSIVYHNRALMGPNYADEASEQFSFSCTTPLPPQGNNMDSDPRLASWFHLSTASPCLNAGLSGDHPGIPDMDGQPFGNPPSMGATELMKGLDMGPLSVRFQTDAPRVSVGFTSLFRLNVDGQATQTRWDFGDGVMVTNQLIVNHAWTTPGVYAVKLTAWNDSTGEEGVTAIQSITVSHPPTFYVDRANATPRFPYTTWATAATNIQDAIDASDVSGRLISVTNGVYDVGGVTVWATMTNRVALRNAVMVRSVNGPAFTTIRGAPSSVTSSVGDGAIRCAYVGDGSVLDGFTLSGGHTRAAGHASREQGGGGVWSESRGTVRNCVFVGNRAARDGGGANGGSYENCWFKNNYADDQGGAADDAQIQNCVLADNGAGGFGSEVSESHVRHSTLVSKSRQQIGVAMYSRLENCILSQSVPGMIYAFALNHCCVPPGIILIGTPKLSNNITNEPAFVNPDGGDYRLLPGSPCIDAAVTAPGLLSVDFNGLPRPLDGNRDGRAAGDIGAYEFNPLFFTSIEHRSNLLRLRWYDTVPGMRLQSTPLLQSAWTDLPITPGVNSLEVPVGLQNAAFRLILTTP